MKVCILALSRSSSTNLLFTISKLYNFDNIYCEPFIIKENDIILKDTKSTDSIFLSSNVILKQIVSVYNLPNDLKTIDELFLWVNKEFDKVICLYREDTKSQAESLVFHSMNQTSEYDWWVKPKIVDVSDIPFSYIDFFKKQYDENTIILKEFANRYKYLIVKYEDLIENEGDNELFREICKYLNIEFNYEVIYEFYNKNRKTSLKGKKTLNKFI